VKLDRDQEVAILTLNNPTRHNALSVELRRTLVEHLRGCVQDKECRGIVLTGQGESFCAGGEVKPVNGADSKPDAERTQLNIRYLHDIVRLLAAGGKPTVAAVSGYCYGAGMSLAMACDYVVATPSAKFAASFCKVGLMADAGLLWSLPNRVGMGAARLMLLSGREADGERAHAIGLCDELVAQDQLLTNAVATARELGCLAPLAVAAMKKVLAQGAASLDEVLAAEERLQPELTLTKDYLEGRLAFRERRAPRFKGQ